MGAYPGPHNKLVSAYPGTHNNRAYTYLPPSTSLKHTSEQHSKSPSHGPSTSVQVALFIEYKYIILSFCIQINCLSVLALALFMCESLALALALALIKNFIFELFGRILLK